MGDYDEDSHPRDESGKFTSGGGGGGGPSAKAWAAGGKGASARETSSKARAATDATKRGSRTAVDHAKAEFLHFEASTAHNKAAFEAKERGDTAAHDHHREEASKHVKQGQFHQSQKLKRSREEGPRTSPGPSKAREHRDRDAGDY